MNNMSILRVASHRLPHASPKRFAPILAFLVVTVAVTVAVAVPGCAPDDGGPRSVLSDSAAASARAACTFKSGTMAGLSLAQDAKLGSQIPIDTIVVLTLENRSMDHLFANLKAAGQPDADVAIFGATNVAEDGTTVTAYHDTDLCFTDTNHEWSGSHRQYNDGKNDGFALTNRSAGDLTGRRALSYYTEVDLPYVYDLANRFAIGDRYFCSLLGPTFPNRFYLYAATSFGNTENQVVAPAVASIFDSLSTAKVDWRAYWDTVPGSALLLDQFGRHLNDHYDGLSVFYAAAKDGTLPPVSFVDPNLRFEDGAGDDFHPPSDVQSGDAFVAQITNALLQSPQWPHMAFFITFDEHGGLYDHVPPPSACPPDDLLPKLAAGEPAAKFDRLGFRVPFIVVSPYAKAHSVSHHVYDHTSVLRFIEARFKIPALTARDANAEPLYDLFDFTKPAFLTPPQMAAVKVDQARLDACKKRFPPKPIGGMTPDAGTMPDAGTAPDAG